MQTQLMESKSVRGGEALLALKIVAWIAAYQSLSCHLYISETYRLTQRSRKKAKKCTRINRENVVYNMERQKGIRERT